MISYKEIQSEALKANLDQTRNVKIIIPDIHLWFLSLSEEYWGIHKRTEEFFMEFHHPYSNRKEIVELLISISISDFWIYSELPEIDKVIEIILDIFDTLLSEKLNDELSNQLVYSYLDFFNKNFDIISKYESLVIKYVSILDKSFEAKYFSFISNLSYFIKSFKKATSEPKTNEYVLPFLCKLINKNVSYWDTTTNIELWYQANKVKLSKDYSETVNSLGSEFFQRHYRHISDAKNYDELCCNIFTFSDIIEAFRKITDEFETAMDQFCYIFYLLHLPGMIYHRNYLLVDLNNTIKRVSNDLDEAQIVQSIDELFALFTDFKDSDINLILDSILTLGKEIINTHNEKLIHYFEDHTIKFGFVNPGVAYLTNNWELKVNPNHVKNIRVWLEIIEYNPEMMKRLLSALIIDLRIGGIFIFDTDLFQKDVTKLLNSKISPIYKQIKQLTRIFPVYFNEIGAEGVLRDVTTRIDEISQRNDRLIHFLRKQIHTEGNNSHIQITLDIIHFWYDLNIDRLINIVPENVLDTIDIESSWVVGVHEVIHKVCRMNDCKLEDLLELDDINNIVAKVTHENANDIKRVGLIIQLYQLLKEKYSFEVNDIAEVLKSYSFFENTDIDKLEQYLNSDKDVEALKLIFSFMVQLNQIIFDPIESEGWENIYYKRHIAFGIPSMYGEYHERKFEALGLTFRLERIVSHLVTQIISKINTEYFTAKTLKDICLVIQLLREGLSLDGIYDQGFDSKLAMFQYSLTSGIFTIKQYINIFQFMEVSIKEIINTYFIRPYHNLLNMILPHYFPTGDADNSSLNKKSVVQKSEMFYRELLSSAFLIQILDNFFGVILNNLRKMITNLSDEEIQNIMTYDPELSFSPLNIETPTIDNQVFIGSKAYYLKKLYLNNFPVPPGFVITTEIFRRVNSIIKLTSLNKEIDDLIKSHLSELEKISGKKYGDPTNPLLLSVRSGAAMSMPGAMNTFLNVGLNDEITEILSKQENFAWTSWDCYRRLLQTWGMSFGINRNEFDQIMLDYKKKHKVSQKIEFPPHIMRKIAYSYKKLLKDSKIPFEEEPFMQLKQSIISVFASWNTSRAKIYREHMHIAEEWGTAVTVQQMVLGNLHRESGSGVIFTHDVQDNTSGINLTGDFSFLSQGEDIVAGLISTLPISERQRKKYYNKSPQSLESAFPEIYDKLKEIASELIETYGFSHQEIEFTFETPRPEDLYILQTRDMSIKKHNKYMVFSSSQTEMERIGCGIGIGNDVLNGVIVFDHNDLKLLKDENAEAKAILVRPDTVPDDIEIIFECDGLLTAKGGATSHSAVTADTLGKICVVNCGDMFVNEKEKICVISGYVLHAFDPIAIDGNNGIIYKGNYPFIIQEL